MTEQEKMLAGRLYSASDPFLTQQRLRARGLVREICQTPVDAGALRERLFRTLLGAAGKNLMIEPPFRCDYGSNIFIGDNFYANFDCIILDVCPVTIGDNVLLGPRVCLFTASHPVDPSGRSSGLEFGKPISIGNDVWIGGGALINPGVTIGNASIIGAGVVVTRDIPDHVIAAGNPCRVVRPVTGEDRAQWEAMAAQYQSGEV